MTAAHEPKQTVARLSQWPPDESLCESLGTACLVAIASKVVVHGDDSKRFDFIVDAGIVLSKRNVDLLKTHSVGGGKDLSHLFAPKLMLCGPDREATEQAAKPGERHYEGDYPERSRGRPRYIDEGGAARAQTDEGERTRYAFVEPLVQKRETDMVPDVKDGFVLRALAHVNSAVSSLALVAARAGKKVAAQAVAASSLPVYQVSFSPCSASLLVDCCGSGSAQPSTEADLHSSAVARMGSLLLTAVLALTGCACAPSPSLEIAMGANVTPYLRNGRTGGFDGGVETVRFTFREDFSPRYFGALTHRSHLSKGRPFNHRHEDFYDVVEIGVRFGGGR